MKKCVFLICIGISQFFSLYAGIKESCNEPDSASLFAYATRKNGDHNGLHFAWSRDNQTWHAIGPEHSFLKSDYGAWGRDKRMISPVLLRSADGMWYCVWKLNEEDRMIGHAASTDLVNWKRQSYPEIDSMTQKQRLLLPRLLEKGVEKRVFDGLYTGTLHRVSWTEIDRLIKAQQLGAYRSTLFAETTLQDPARFASLEPVNATITVDASKNKKISDLLIGIFFEDINYAADGGVYAELIQNRGFEYDLSDKQGADKTWTAYKAWTLKGEKTTFTVDSVTPLHHHNRQYARLEVSHVGASLVNEGFNGIPVKANEKYNFSLFGRLIEGKGGRLIVRLVDNNGGVCAESTVKLSSSEWKKQEIALTSTSTTADAKLEIIPQFTGTIALDMISLFPQKTFKGRKNGLREDLAQVLADMKPRFVRFPGGCVAHGNGLHNMYRWKNTIGPLEARKPQRNIWNYHQSMGLGYYEYFLFCEDIGAEPLPVVAAGVPCQNSSIGGGGQQGGIPMCEMEHYVQEILDLIEWANGDAKTTWGKLRAEAGHPKPFNLKYIGVGNEDLITDVFEERFTMIYNAVKEKHPEITVIGTVGPFSEGTDYVEGWEVATKLGVPMVDEHYYQPPGWFIHNQDFYDRYDRGKSKVYLGEYAAHLRGRRVNIETALAEALYLTALERNGDVVSMTSYAPLLAKEGFTQWNPDLIYFNNTEVKPTVGYHVQKLYGQNAGDEYLPATISLSNTRDDVHKRIAYSVVRDSKTNEVVVKLVNLLPVAVQSTVVLEQINLSSSMADVTLLTGLPDDEKAMPVTSTMPVDNEFVVALPAYSFVVVKMQTRP